MEGGETAQDLNLSYNNSGCSSSFVSCCSCHKWVYFCFFIKQLLFCYQLVFLMPWQRIKLLLKPECSCLQIDWCSDMEIKDNEATVCGEWRVAVERLENFVAEIRDWRRGWMLLPTQLPHRPVGALRGHAAHGNSSLFSQASGHLTVLQPVCSSSTSASQLVIDLWAFFQLCILLLLAYQPSFSSRAFY